MLTRFAEGESKSKMGENDLAWSQFWVQPHRSQHACHHIHHIQHNQAFTPAQQSSSLGSNYKAMAAISSPLHLLRLARYLYDRLLGLLEGRSQESRKGCSLLHNFHCCILRVLYR